jgi:microcystin-dependent protein
MWGEGTMGEIRLFAGNFEPQHWMFCDGRILDLRQNTALFVLLGTRFGGDARTTFGLPDLEDPVFGMHYIICVGGYFPARP